MSKIIQLFKLNIDYSSRIFGLDLLRFFAIFFVMYLHAGRFFPRGYKTEYLLFSYDGVGIFFVLSGFLIGRILINQLMKYQLNKNFLLDFWIRRWFMSVLRGLTCHLVLSSLSMLCLTTLILTNHRRTYA